MKPFNLEEALAGKPVVTRNGRKVLKVADFSEPGKPRNYPLVALVENDYGTRIFTLDGSYISGVYRDCDLFMATSKKTGWVNIYEGDLNFSWRDSIHMGAFLPKSSSGQYIHASKEAAEERKSDVYRKIGIAQIEWEE